MFDLASTPGTEVFLTWEVTASFLSSDRIKGRSNSVRMFVLWSVVCVDVELAGLIVLIIIGITCVSIGLKDEPQPAQAVLTIVPNLSTIVQHEERARNFIRFHPGDCSAII